MVPAVDISKYQGAWQNYPADIIMIKISGGDDGLYYDPDAANNYNQTIAAGKAFSGYHFAGGTDPVAEANFFVAGMKPLNAGEVPALDWEVSNPNPPAWCDAFIEQVRVGCGNPNQGGLLYMNLSTLLAYDWSVPLSKWGLWLADWNNNPAGTINTGGKTYVMQQFNDGPNYDHDEWFGTVDEFKQYGWAAPVAAPNPTPPAPTPPVVTPPVVTPPVVTPPVVTPPVVTPPATTPTTPTAPTKPTTPVKPTTPPVVTPAPRNLLAAFFAWLRKVF